MKKKFREIVVDGVTYGWQVKGYGDCVWIWKDKKVILKERLSLHPITPKIVEDVIRYKVLKQEPPQYVLLRGEKYQNVFWTTYDPFNDYDDEGLEVLYIGNTSDEMVREWNKYNPLLAQMLKSFENLSS